MKAIMFSAMAVFALFANANMFDAIEFRGFTDKANPAGYKVGEKITLTLTLANAPKELYSGDYAIDWTRKGDDGKESQGRLALDGKTPLKIETSLDRPGNIMVQAFVVTAADGKKVKRDKMTPGNPAWEGGGNYVFFIGGALVEPEKIVSAHEEPADFDEFWNRQKARLAAVPATVLERREVTPENYKNCRVWAVTVNCAGPRPVTGYLTIPKNAAPKSLEARCIFQGYGCGPQGVPGDNATGRIEFEINAHGYDLEAIKDKEYYQQFLDGIKTAKYGYAFSPWQNEYPEGCYFNGMALRVLRAFDFVRSLPEWNGKELSAKGGSQGGLQTMWAVGLVDSLTYAEPVVPWCADLGPDAVAGRMAPPWRIAWTKGISYYDCVNHAKRAKAKVFISRAGLGDTCCMPSSIQAIYNNLPEDKRSILWVQGSKHGYVPTLPNQCVELPAMKFTAPYEEKNVYTGDKLPE